MSFGPDGPTEDDVLRVLREVQERQIKESIAEVVEEAIGRRDERLREERQATR